MPVGALTVVIVAGALLWRYPKSRGVVLGGLAAVAVVLLAAPAAWSLAGVQHAQSGTFPDARPTASGAGAAAGPNGFPGGAGAATGPNGFPGGAGTAPAGGGPAGADGGFGGAGVSGAELQWLQSQRAGEDWILGVSSSMQSASAVIDGYDVVALGGFSGSDNAATPARVADLVEQGRLRFLAVGGGLGGFGGGGGLSTAVSSACVAVDASKWGGSGTSGVYDCQGKAAAIRTAGAKASTQPGAGPGAGPGLRARRLRASTSRRCRSASRSTASP